MAVFTPYLANVHLCCRVNNVYLDMCALALGTQPSHVPRILGTSLYQHTSGELFWTRYAGMRTISVFPSCSALATSLARR